MSSKRFLWFEKIYRKSQYRFWCDGQWWRRKFFANRLIVFYFRDRRWNGNCCCGCILIISFDILRSCVKEIFAKQKKIVHVRMTSDQTRLEWKILFISFKPSQFWFLVIVFILVFSTNVKFCAWLPSNDQFGWFVAHTHTDTERIKTTTQHPLHHIRLSEYQRRCLVCCCFLSVFFILAITKAIKRSFKMIVQVFYCLKILSTNYCCHFCRALPIRVLCDVHMIS